MAQSIRPYVDRQLGGNLEQRLRERRAAGESLADIARWLDREHGVTITPEAVRQWCRAYGISTERQAS